MFIWTSGEAHSGITSQTLSSSHGRRRSHERILVLKCKLAFVLQRKAQKTALQAESIPLDALSYPLARAHLASVTLMVSATRVLRNLALLLPLVRSRAQPLAFEIEEFDTHALPLASEIELGPRPLPSALELDTLTTTVGPVDRSRTGRWLSSMHPVEPPSLPVVFPDLAADARPFVIEAMLPPREPRLPTARPTGRWPPGAPLHPLHPDATHPGPGETARRREKRRWLRKALVWMCARWT